MNVSLQNNDKVSAKLTVKLEKADYEAKVEKTLKDYRKKANVPGFRPGQVPMSLVKKMYGTSVKAEEINKTLQEAAYGYIKENKLNILGEPLPNEEQQANIDIANQDEFDFVFDVALSPEFELEVEKTDKVSYYNIEVSDEMVENQINMYRQRGGKYDKVDVYQDRDMVKGLIAELDETGNTKEGGLQVPDAVLMPAYMKEDAQKAIFADCKVNDVLIFNPYIAFAGAEAEIASMLKINKEEVSSFTGNFSIQIEEITRFVLGDLNQELFDTVFEPGTVTTEEDFRAKMKDSVSEQYVADSDFKFLLDARDVFVAKAGKLEFADAILKRLMLINNSDKDATYIEENYDKNIQELTWHIIKEKLVQKFEIKVEQSDILNAAKDATKAQFAQYGMINIPEDVLNNYATEMLKKREQAESLINRAVEAKLATALKKEVSLKKKKISMEDFNKMFEQPAEA